VKAQVHQVQGSQGHQSQFVMGLEQNVLQPKSRNYFVSSIHTKGKQLPTVDEEQTHSYSEFS
jgi:hypothetical protein